MLHDREYWRQHMLAHHRSRLTQTAYCLQNGLHTKTYRTWCRKLEAAGEAGPVRASDVGARVVDGAEVLAYPLLPASPSGPAELVGTVAQRQRYTVEERQQHVLMALQSGLPIERYAHMAGDVASGFRGTVAGSWPSSMVSVQVSTRIQRNALEKMVADCRAYPCGNAKPWIYCCRNSSGSGRGSSRST